eukprot:8556031-Pyramimonas_sp.AAC.1
MGSQEEQAKRWKRRSEEMQMEETRAADAGHTSDNMVHEDAMYHEGYLNKMRSTCRVKIWQKR